MTETATGYEFRAANPSDAGFLARAQEAGSYEVDEPLPQEEIFDLLLAGGMESYILIGPKSRLTVSVRREYMSACLGVFYREGQSEYGLLTEATIMLEKVIDRLDRDGIRQLFAFISRENPKRDKLIRFYRRLNFEPDLVRMRRFI